MNTQATFYLAKKHHIMNKINFRKFM